MKTINTLIIYTNTQIEKQEELKELVAAADQTVLHTIQQDVKSIDFRTYIGSGKVIEIKDYLDTHKIDHIQFDIDLSSLQIRNLEEVWEHPVYDRTELILKIFQTRAQTKIAKLQIESASLKKQLPRLIGSNTQLSRQSGGKNKGTGEKQLEIDRRRIKARIHEVQKELKEVKMERMTQRKQREKNEIPLAALVGYTNAGKSTIMNGMLDHTKQKENKKVLQKDLLFATLDTAVRLIATPDHQDFLLSDTVGFVSDLPHDLIDAFHSTLEEITYADLLIHVVDASDPHYDMQQLVTKQTLSEIKAADIPMITVFNKCDRTNLAYPKCYEDRVYINAKDSQSIQFLMDIVISKLYPDRSEVTLLIPYENGSVYSHLNNITKIKDISHEENGILCHAVLTKLQQNQYQQFIIS